MLHDWRFKANSLLFACVYVLKSFLLRSRRPPHVRRGRKSRAQVQNQKLDSFYLITEQTSERETCHFSTFHPVAFRRMHKANLTKRSIYKQGFKKICPES
ncbi:uncharacterized [Tachysurus ichikawai]